MRTQDEIQTWRQGADHYAKLAGEHTDASCQLACLILADYCVYQWSGDHGGPHQQQQTRLIRDLVAERDAARAEADQLTRWKADAQAAAATGEPGGSSS